MRILIAVAALMVMSVAPAGAVTGCSALGGVVRDGLCEVRQSEPTYEIALRYPLGYPDEQAVVDYLATIRAGFLDTASTPSPQGSPMALDVTSASLGSTSTRSVILTVYQNVGGAHPTTWYRSFNYDLVRGRPITFDTLFAPGTQPLKTIFPLVRGDLERQTGLTDLVADGLDPSHYQNFAITNNELTFYFGRGEMLPAVAGEMSVTLPRNAIPPLAV